MLIRDSSQMKPIFLISILFSSLLLAACESWLPNAHRLDLTQGNAIERESLDKIQLGMSKTEVTQIIGHPILTDPFHAGRWDYLYQYTPGKGESVQSRLTLYFENDSLVKIDDTSFREPQNKQDAGSKDPEAVDAIPKPDID